MSGSARAARLEADGWELADAEELLAAGDGVYWLPARWEREHLDDRLEDGGYAKLVFRLADPASPGARVTERMWVSLDGRQGEWYHGRLANTPHAAARAREGMPVWFRAEHVIDFTGPDGEGQASSMDGVVHCERHGPSAACNVCEHLVPEAEPRGFNTAANTAEPRPDAWCDGCDRLLDGVDGWDDVGDRHPRIRLVCGGCYDDLRRLHARADEA